MADTIYDLSGHNCDSCAGSGSCPIEHVVRHFQGREEEFDKAHDAIENLMQSSFGVLLRKFSTNSHFIAVHAIMTGYVMGQGVEVKMPTLEELTKRDET